MIFSDVFPSIFGLGLHFVFFIFSHKCIKWKQKTCDMINTGAAKTTWQKVCPFNINCRFSLNV
jgi:hypothetical protein